MAFIIIPGDWQRQPSAPTGIDWTNSLTNQLRLAIPHPLRGDAVSGTKLTLGTGASLDPTRQGMALKGSGAAAVGSIALDLSAYYQITIAFWLNWVTFANDDKLAMEFTANTGANAGGFLIDPNSSGGATPGPAPGSTFDFYANRTVGAADERGGTIARPTVGLHHYVITHDRNVAAGSTTFLVDGVAQTVTDSVNGSPSTNTTTFANSTLFLLSRNNASLFATGSLLNLTIHGRILAAAEQQALYTNGWQIYRPISRRIYFNASAGGPVTVALTGLGATASLGTLAPALDKALTGQSITASRGTLVPNLDKALTGQAVTASGGTLVPNLSIALTGLAMTASGGTLSLSGNVTVALTGLTLTTALGTFTPDLSKGLTGLSVTASRGSLAVSTSVALAGLQATASYGTLTPSGGDAVHSVWTNVTGTSTAWSNVAGTTSIWTNQSGTSTTWTNQ